jgi:hypothetical protein
LPLSLSDDGGCVLLAPTKKQQFVYVTAQCSTAQHSMAVNSIAC